MRSVTVGLAALAMGSVAVLATAQPAFAAPCPAGTYPPSNSCIVVSPPSSDLVQERVPAGTPAGTIVISFNLGGFDPFSRVHIQLHSDVIDLGYFTADAQGFISGTAEVAPDQIPASFDFGAHTLTFAGTLANGQFGVLSAPITIRKSLTHKASGGSTSSSSSSSGGTVAVTGGVTAPQPAKAPGTTVPGTTAGGVQTPKVIDTKDSPSNTSTAVLALVGAAILGGGLILVVARRRGGVTPTSTL